MLIDETTTAESRQEVANNLVKLFLGQGLVKEFLDVLFKLELEKTSKQIVVSWLYISKNLSTSYVHCDAIDAMIFVVVVILQLNPTHYSAVIH